MVTLLHIPVMQACLGAASTPLTFAAMMFPYCAFFPCSRFVLACSTAATGTCIAACVLRPQITAALLHRLYQGGGWLSRNARIS